MEGDFYKNEQLATTGRLVDFVVETICENKRVRDVIAEEIRNMSKRTYWNIENQANMKSANIEMIISKSEKLLITNDDYFCRASMKYT
jgi:hypothetical protein